MAEEVDDEGKVLKAFKKLAMKWHPDRNIDNQEEAHEKAKVSLEFNIFISFSKKSALSGFF